MISWDRCGGKVIMVFSPRQVRWLRRHLNDYRHRVERQLASPGDDPRLSELLSPPGGDVAFGLRRAHDSLGEVLADLPDCGGVVEIGSDEKRMTWIWTLQELRGVLALRLGLDRLGPLSSFDRAGAAFKVQFWLSEAIRTLIDAAELPLEPCGPHGDSQFRYLRE